MAAVWFKHFNTAHQGQLITDLMSEKRYDCVALWYVILEFISRYEEVHASGVASIPLDTLARAMNMKPSRTMRLLTHISFVSRSDLICETDEKQPRNVVFRLANWAKLQQTRGIYDRHKTSIKPVEVRSKKLEVRSKNAQRARANVEFEPKNTNPHLEECTKEWQSTLIHYGIKRDARSDEAIIAQAIARYSLADVLDALRGFRFEKPGKDYDPAQNVSARRLLMPNSFDRLRNIGAQRSEQVTRRKVLDAIPESQ